MASLRALGDEILLIVRQFYGRAKLHPLQALVSVHCALVLLQDPRQKRYGSPPRQEGQEVVAFVRQLRQDLSKDRQLLLEAQAGGVHRRHEGRGPGGLSRCA